MISSLLSWITLSWATCIAAAAPVVTRLTVVSSSINKEARLSSSVSSLTSSMNFVFKLSPATCFADAGMSYPIFSAGTSSSQYSDALFSWAIGSLLSTFSTKSACVHSQAMCLGESGISYLISAKDITSSEYISGDVSSLGCSRSSICVLGSKFWLSQAINRGYKDASLITIESAVVFSAI